MSQECKRCGGRCKIIFIVLLLAGVYLWVRFHRDRPVDYANAEEHFKYGSTGGERDAGIPVALWNILPDLFGKYLPGRGLASLGFLYETNRPFPIGVSERNVQGVDRVFLNCAVCHTGTVRDTPDSPHRVIVGMPANGMNLQAFERFLFASSRDEDFNPQRLTDEIAHRHSDGWLNRALFRYVAIDIARQRLITLAQRFQFMDREPDTGPGRVDTFNPPKVLLNFRMDDLPANEWVGNCDFPSIWNQSKRQGMRLHWDGNNDSVDERNRSAAYRFTKHYALGQKKYGLSLGTAVAISGAAASPNQGYHSSPMVALLMTLFNVRLGWWLGNPGAMGHDTFHDSAPRSPVRHMVKEGFGLTDSSSPYVYLSDGGHFENLGLYEMILRRCRLIVVSDAGCDPECSLEDLGNAIRKIRVDLGVQIEIKEFKIFSRTDAEGKISGRYCAIGEIDYGTADEGGRKGTLIYLKPALLGDEPRDIYNYSRESETFPHEATSDQWFSESQFESYRALGQRTIEWIYEQKSGPAPAESSRAEVLADFISQACAAAKTSTPPDTVNLFSPENPAADAGAKI